jgi:hypothetical protein
MNDTAFELAKALAAAKKAEDAAIKARRAIEDELVAMLKVDPTKEGTRTEKLSGAKLKFVGRMNRKIDDEKLQELAREAGVYEHLPSLFRWKPEIKMKEWKVADASITKPLLPAITTTPGRPSVSVELASEDDTTTSAENNVVKGEE